jgi:hypothetical protein
LEEGRLGGIGDDVGDDPVREEAGDGEGGGDVGEETDAGGVDDDGGVWRERGGMGEGEADDFRDERGEEGGERCGAVGVAVDEGDAGGAGEGEFDGDGAGGSAGSEDDDVLVCGVDDRAETFEEALAVGVFAEPAAVGLADGAIDGTDDGGGGGETVEVADDGDFVRETAIEAEVALGFCAADGIGEVFRGDLHVDVAGVEIVVVEGGFHHDDGGVFGDWLCEAADEGGEEVGHGEEGDRVVGEGKRDADREGGGVQGTVTRRRRKLELREETGVVERQSSVWEPSGLGMTRTRVMVERDHEARSLEASGSVMRSSERGSRVKESVRNCSVRSGRPGPCGDANGWRSAERIGRLAAERGLVPRANSEALAKPSSSSSAESLVMECEDFHAG